MDWIHVFKAGTQTCADGRTMSFTRENLDSIVAKYDPKVREVPIVIGHPQPSHPAYGWVESLKRVDDMLFMKAKQVVPEFAAAVDSGRYKKCSIKVNPKTWELVHVGILGAAEPAVDGLGDVCFSKAEDADAVTLEFSSFNYGSMLGRMFQGLRDHLVDTIGLEKANQVVNQWDIDNLKEMGMQPDAAAFSAAPVPAAVPTPSVRETELEGENARLRADIETRDLAVRQADNLSFCKQLVSEGKLLPAQQEEAMALLTQGTDPAFSFSKSSGEAPGALLKSFLSKMTAQIGLGEFAKGGRAALDASDAGALADKAMAFMKAEADKGNNIDAAKAVNHILTQGATR